MEKDEVRDSLDASLESLEKSLETGPSEEELQALLSDDAVRAKVTEMLQKAKKDEEEDDEEEEEDEESAEAPVAEEEEEEKEKSEDGTNEEFLDAVPVMKSLHSTLKKVQETLNLHSTVLKSLVEAAREDVALSKSVNEAVSVFSRIPRPRKAAEAAPVNGNSTGVMAKSFGEAEGAPIRTADIRRELQKAFEAKEIDLSTVSKAEMSGWRPEAIPSFVLARIRKEE